MGQAIALVVPSIGDLYYDTDLQALLYWNGSEWVPVGTEAIAIGDLTDVDDTGAANGMVLVYDNGTWKPVSPASLAVEVDLDYTSDGDNAGTVTNSAGDDAASSRSPLTLSLVCLPAKRSRNLPASKKAQKQTCGKKIPATFTLSRCQTTLASARKHRSHN